MLVGRYFVLLMGSDFKILSRLLINYVIVCVCQC